MFAKILCRSCGLVVSHASITPGKLIERECPNGHISYWDAIEYEMVLKRSHKLSNVIEQPESEENNALGSEE